MATLSLFLVVAGWLPSAARADVIYLQSGDRISGKVTGFEGGSLTVETDYAGSLTIARSALTSISTDLPVFVVFTDGSTANGVVQSSGGRAMSVRRGDAVLRRGFSFSNIDAISRTATTARRFKWSGNVNLGFSQTDGNSDTQTLNANGGVTGRSKKHRISIDAEYNRETDSGSESVDNARLRAQHDRFVNDKLYFFTNGSAERDDVADLELRATLGTGLGYQVYDTDETKLSVQAGPTFVHDDFEFADAENSLALGWSVNFEQRLFSGTATLFHNHDGLFDLTNDNALVVFAAAGVRVPFDMGFNATAQVEVDYDSKPAAGVGTTDTKYIVTLGYEW